MPTRQEPFARRDYAMFPRATRASPGSPWLQQVSAIKVFTDARSGRSMDRPGLAALLDYAQSGDTLAVVRLDRLGRSPAEPLATVALLKERGIALVSLEERLDTGSAAGELVFHVFGAVAHFERRLGRRRRLPRAPGHAGDRGRSAAGRSVAAGHPAGD